MAGISIATRGVVFISADATPIGAISRRNAWRALWVVESSSQLRRVTTPVWTIPLARTSMAPMVMTPGFERPDTSSSTVASPRMPASTRPPARASTGGTRRDAMATSVPVTTAAATAIVASALTSAPRVAAALTEVHVPQRRTVAARRPQAQSDRAVVVMFLSVGLLATLRSRGNAAQGGADRPPSGTSAAASRAAASRAGGRAHRPRFAAGWPRR